MRHVATALVLAGLAGTAAARPPAEAPYRVEVWSDVLFDADGRATEYRVVDEATFPAAFVEQVRARLAQARIDPPQVDGRAASFRTGVRMAFEIQPAKQGGSARLTGLVMSPLPVARTYVKFPTDILRTAGWTGTLDVVCTVTVEGRCGSTGIRGRSGLPESARRWAQATFDRWRFQPQQVDGVPVEGEYVQGITMQVEGDEGIARDRYVR